MCKTGRPSWTRESNTTLLALCKVPVQQSVATRSKRHIANNVQLDADAVEWTHNVCNKPINRMTSGAMCNYFHKFTQHMNVVKPTQALSMLIRWMGDWGGNRCMWESVWVIKIYYTHTTQQTQHIWPSTWQTYLQVVIAWRRSLLKTKYVCSKFWLEVVIA